MHGLNFPVRFFLDGDPVFEAGLLATDFLEGELAAIVIEFPEKV
jgi:hypothetical protein